MSGHRRYREMISLYIDGQLPGDEKKELLSHANGCEECSSLLQSYFAMSRDLRRLPGVIPDISFHTDTMDELRKHPCGRRKLSYRLRLQLTDLFSRGGIAGLAGAVSVMLVFVLSASTLAVCLNEYLLPRSKSDSPSAAAYDSQLIAGLSNNYDGITEIYTNYGADSGYGYEPDAEISESKATGYGGSPAPAMAEVNASPAAARSFSIDESEPAPQNTAEEGLAQADMYGRYAGDGFMAKEYYITIETPDAQDAVFLITAMGFNVSGSSISTYNTPNGSGYSSGAGLTINVPSEDFDSAVNAISGIGSVTYSNISSYSQAGQIARAAANLSAKQEEYERLVSYLDKAGDLNSLILLQDRVYSVISDIDYCKIQLNALYNSVSTPKIYLDVIEPRASVEPDTAMVSRLREGFTGSIAAVATAAQQLLISAAGLIIPLSILILMALPVRFLYLLIRKGKGKLC